MVWRNTAFDRLWNPWKEFEAEFTRNRDFPPMNVWLSENQATVTAELPGVEPAETDISVSGETLTLKGQRKPEELKEGEAYFRQERGFGSFSRTITLPFRPDADAVQAKFHHGVLSVVVPRAEADKPRKISVKG